MALYPYFFYCVAVDRTDETSPFAGISPTMLNADWAMSFVCTLPITIAEPTMDWQHRIALRVAGSSYRFVGLQISDLDKLNIDSSQPFWIMISAAEETASATEAWRRRQEYPPLHVSTVEIADAVHPRTVTLDVLRHFVSNTVSRIAEKEPAQREAVLDIEAVLRRWREFPKVELPYVQKLHHCTDINNTVLESVGYTFLRQEQFTANRDSEYVDAIISSYDPIDKVRAKAPLLELHRRLPPVPELFVFAPGMYRAWYEHKQSGRRLDDAFGSGASTVFKLLQKQSGYKIDVPAQVIEKLALSPELNFLLFARGRELHTQSAAVAVRASSHFATTIRLPLGINRTLGRIRQLGFNARSANRARRRKFVELFHETQAELQAAIDPRLLERIDRVQFGIKFISDAPLEWLPSGDIPISMRHDVTRIPATPGNLSIMVLTGYRGIGLRPHSFHEILHVDAAPVGDPVHGIVRRAFEIMAPSLGESVRVRHVEANSVDSFIECVNSYDGPLMIFDGHGSHTLPSDTGHLHIGQEEVDAWELRGRLRPPPIVLLSACDTHALDRSHATVANGFLSMGVASVIATLLPIGILESALFCARFALRLAMFVPGAIKVFGRSLRWPEIVSGMLRMQLASDVLFGLASDGKLREDLVPGLMTFANKQINAPPRLDWYERLVAETARQCGADEKSIRMSARRQVALSDAIRYIHIGNAEHITVLADDEVQQSDEVGEAEYYPQT